MHTKFKQIGNFTKTTQTEKIILNETVFIKIFFINLFYFTWFITAAIQNSCNLFTDVHRGQTLMVTLWAGNCLEVPHLTLCSSEACSGKGGTHSGAFVTSIQCISCCIPSDSRLFVISCHIEFQLLLLQMPLPALLYLLLHAAAADTQ